MTVSRYLTKSELAHRIPSAIIRKDRKKIKINGGKKETSTGISRETLKKEVVKFLLSCPDENIKNFAREWDNKKTIPPRICNLILEHLMGVEA